MRSRPDFSWVSRSIPQPKALRRNCSRAFVEGERETALARCGTGGEELQAVSVLPHPLGPVSRTIASLKNPPPHIWSSSAMPEDTRHGCGF